MVRKQSQKNLEIYLNIFRKEKVILICSAAKYDQ